MTVSGFGYITTCCCKSILPVQSYLWTFTTTESPTPTTPPVTESDNTTDHADGNITRLTNTGVTSYPQSETADPDSPGMPSHDNEATTEPILSRRKRDDPSFSTDRVSGFTRGDGVSGYSDLDWNWNMSVTVTTPTPETMPLYILLNSSASCLSCPRDVRNLDDDYRKYTRVLDGALGSVHVRNLDVDYRKYARVLDGVLGSVHISWGVVSRPFVPFGFPGC